MYSYKILPVFLVNITVSEIFKRQKRVFFDFFGKNRHFRQKNTFIYTYISEHLFMLKLYGKAV